MKYQIQGTADNNILIIEGELTIAHAAEFKNALIQSLENVAEVTLDLANVADVDHSCLQLLCALHKSTIDSGKSVDLRGGFPEVFEQVVKDSGFICQGGCGADCSESCFWINKVMSHE